MRRRWLALGVTGAVLISGAAASAISMTSELREGEKPLTPVQFAPRREPVAPFEDAPGKGVADLAKKLPHVRLAELRTRQPDGELALYVEVTPARAGDGEVAGAAWEGELLAGAVRDVAASSGLGEISELQVTAVMPDGRRVELGGGFGNVVHDQRFSPVTPDQIERVATNARALGLDEVRVRTLQVIQDAIVISARTTDPRDAAQAIANTGVLTRLLEVAPGEYEGVYFEVRDGRGELVYFTATAARTGSGIAWVRPCLGVKVGHRPYSAEEICRAARSSG